MKHPYTVINASAGSGKTYTLVQRLLMICLAKPNQKEAIRHILALTFTNKAANEMKERILNWLGKFVADDYENCDELIKIHKKFKDEQIEMSLKELHLRSKEVLDYILHHYSTLNIGTIDKFNARLVRSFSYELGLAQNFNLEIQAEPYLMQAVDQMLDKVGNDEEISDAFMDYIHYNLDNNERVNLNKVLYKSAKEFVSDVHYQHLENNKNFDWNAYEKAKTDIRTQINALKAENREMGKKCIELLQERDLQVEDFSGGQKNSIAKFFHEVIKYDRAERSFPFPSSEESAMEVFEKGASSKSKNRQAEIDAILEELLDNRQKIIHNHILVQKKEKVLQALLPLRVNKEIQDELAKIEEENDLVLLSKFNVLIHENLKNEPSAFIYEKVGTQFHHYFFDEFQDTSQLQWDNIIPLREHSINTENQSFTLVGDPKQSIYRFRGGDSQLMIDIINGNEQSNIPANVENLPDNYRSAENIVAFNNQLYQYIADSENINEEHRRLFGALSHKNSIKKFKGRVRVNLMENDKKEVFYQDTSTQMQEDIQACLDKGFRFSDICILCRGNFDILNYSQLLGNLKVHYQGQEVFIKTISDKGLTLNLSLTLNALIQFLQWELYPKNKRFLVLSLYYLYRSGRITMQDFSKEVMEILQIDDRKEIIQFIKNKYGVSFSQSDFPHLNLYNFIEYFVHEFAVENKETDFLLNFLEMLYAYTQNSGATLKEFIQFWEEEGSTISIQASENVDAINIMTIHKAKGLEFPVVFLPMENKTKDNDITEWFTLDSDDALKSVNIKGFNDTLSRYDDEILDFNSENSYKNKIDRICLQYVATTRPVEQLFLYIQKPNKTQNHLEIHDFLTQNRKEEDNFDFFEVEEKDLKKQVFHQPKNHQTQSISQLHQKQENLSNIKIATPSKSYQNRNEKVRIGIFTHEILAKIETQNDIENVLESYLLKGTITVEEKNAITERILAIVKHPEYQHYFDENVLEVLNEREIVVSENGISEIYRPDRMIKTVEGYQIIDFKTGEEKEKYAKQLAVYQQAMEKIGKKVVKTEVVYV